MSTKNYSFDESVVQISREDGRKIAIFDVSPTIECRWIGVSNNEVYLLTVFGDTREMLQFVAREQNNGATIFDDGFLDEQAQHEGFDRWAEYVADECGEYTYEA
jgi:hypothetical protein